MKNFEYMVKIWRFFSLTSTKKQINNINTNNTMLYINRKNTETKYNRIKLIRILLFFTKITYDKSIE